MRLTDRIHLVASGSGGFGLTDPFDCHAYLLDGGGEAALVDAGIGAAPERIVANIEAAGVPRERVHHLLLTHAHPDHAGGAAALKRLLPGLQVAASPEAAGWVETADEDAIGVASGKRAEFYPPDFRFSACAVDRRLHGGERLRVGELEVAAVETPGHCAGHLAFVCDTEAGRACFGGDLVFFGGLVSLVNNWDCSIQEYAQSFDRLAGAGIDVLLPGHHSLSLCDGQRHVEAARRRFESGFVPRSIV
jgi:glyoxylase-like metal-dependent hydrolase (beta-lactamase superfamily II)